MSATYRRLIAAINRRLDAMRRACSRANRDSLVLDALNRAQPGQWCRQCGAAVTEERGVCSSGTDGLSFCSADCVRRYEYLA